jgi:succinyl-diaminopimelate desuccinylase
MVIDRRFLIEESLPVVKDEVKNLLERLSEERPGFRYAIRDMFSVEPTMADRNGPVTTATVSAIRRILGKQADIICSPGTYDQKHVDRIGRLKDCIAYGPGIVDLAHQPNEWVGIADMVIAAKIMAVATIDLLTREHG